MNDYLVLILPQNPKTPYTLDEKRGVKSILNNHSLFKIIIKKKQGRTIIRKTDQKMKTVDDDLRNRKKRRRQDLEPGE